MKFHRIPYTGIALWVGPAPDFISSSNEVFLDRKRHLMCSLTHTHTQ